MRITQFVTKRLETVDSPHQEHWHEDLELQIEAATGWKQRIPANGAQSPIDNDGEVPVAAKEVARFGTSGWNWKTGQSEFVVLDFDARDGHSKGLDDADLEAVVSHASKLTYVQIHRSKSGKGVHLYVQLGLGKGRTSIFSRLAGDVHAVWSRSP